ncbi:lipopolysaccharide biosynthesis protein [Sporosarcina thermotolerans]|uniref:Lipopolysaccharide biosynthesis protein n=1 Tax=Sporosarcina thermotolerans TaxID=633404 RepID=A0AAW9A5X9_9BACL|nr:lipopolysaccharide biosynthesis protein [Sporosarcina thermotolerans]MDW0116300.1 lipopolysaccharide biosynthesis protein [Sporosarcina thermotolerans]WHT48268.1 lipopolysaccharide biosynthesis protein [Sporosarcina thermotolerans]
MNNAILKNKMLNAAKWSSITEITVKIIAPFTNMVLARILAPEAFGIVATVTMITSFADMFTDAGFQKYLVQHEFRDNKEKYKNANVAFLTNLFLSFLIWGIIVSFSERIAILIGNPGLGIVISVSCLQLPITAFSSIQMALYRREFDFKTLFLVRVISIFIPVLITIPLALLGFSYWSLIIGNIFMTLSNAIFLTIKSKWKPKLFFRLKILKEMLSFSIWSLIEAISIWLTIWIDTFIIASALSEHYLGIYKTSTTMVNALMATVTASIVPVLFSTLSRLQNNNEEFNKTFFQMQRLVSILVFPMGVGVFLFSDLATRILLGSQWTEAGRVIGIWALTSAIVIVLSHFCSEVFRAKGKPRLSFLAQMLHLIVLVPVCIISSKFGFWALVYARSWVRLQGVLVDFLLMYFVIKFPIFKSITNILPTATAALLMGVFGYILKQLNDSVVWDSLSISFCIFFYFGILYIYPVTRKEINVVMNKLFPSRFRKSS